MLSSSRLVDELPMRDGCPFGELECSIFRSTQIRKDCCAHDRYFAFRGPRTPTKPGNCGGTRRPPGSEPDRSPSERARLFQLPHQRSGPRLLRSQRATQIPSAPLAISRRTARLQLTHITCNRDVRNGRIGDPPEVLSFFYQTP